VRIKNWNSCVPEEVRKKEEFMPIYPFEKTVIPGRFPSPFVGKSTGTGGKRWPGGILPDAVGGGDVGVKEEGVGEGGRKRTRRAAAGGGQGETSRSGANAAALSSLASGYQYQPSGLSQQVQVPKPPGPDRSVITTAGGVAVLGQGAQIEKLPPETGM
jgi:chromatin structure-remodeling complex subunit RSC1/2